jgi:glycosyltransferase involved in cell wall biosynthesis
MEAGEQPERTIRILMVPAKSFPSDHAMLDAVYARILPGRGHGIEWVMWGEGRGLARWRDTVVHLVPPPRGGVVGVLRSWFELYRTVARVARAGAFDVIQVRNSAGLGCLALVLRRLTGARFSFQLSFPVLEGAIAAFGRGAVRHPSARALAARIGVAVRDRVVRRADLVLAISDEMRDVLVAVGVSPGRIEVFPLGAEHFRRSPASRVRALRGRLGLGDDPVVLYAGSIAPGRRLDVLVRTAALVLTYHPAARFVIVGKASEGEDARLRALAVELGVADRVHVLPPVPRSEVTTFVSAASVVVSPVPPTDLYRVSSPTKAVEALALACPAVVTPIRDQAELVRASGGGRVAAFEPETFAAAVSGVLSDPAAARKMGEAGRRYVREHRSYDVLARSVEDRYQRLLFVAGDVRAR